MLMVNFRRLGGESIKYESSIIIKFGNPELQRKKKREERRKKLERIFGKKIIIDILKHFSIINYIKIKKITLSSIKYECSYLDISVPYKTNIHFNVSSLSKETQHEIKNYFRKKKKLSTTIDPILWNLLEEYCEKNNVNKSQFLEKLMKDGLKNNDTLTKMNDEGIILPDSDLLKK